MREVWEFIAEKLKEGRKVGLATIVERVGSAPRSVGSKMAVSEDGESVGSVGGGALEAIVEKKLKELMATGNTRYIFEHRMDAKNIEDGMVCGGRARILLEVLDRSSLSLYESVLDAVRRKKRVFLVKALPPEEGVYLTEEEPKDKKGFVDVIEPEERLVIFGGGHISYYLAKMASMCHFSVHVYDDREDYTTRERFPEAEVKRIDYKDAGRLVEDGDFVVVVTASHLTDKLVLENVLKKKPFYVGMIGSKRKAKKIKEALVEAGLSKDAVDSVKSPIGIEIEAETPCEIAVSILAEMIKERRRGRDVSNN